MPKKGKKMKEKKFVLNKYQKVTRVFTCIFQGLLKKNIVFRSVALVTKKWWAILDFVFHRPFFFPPLPYPN